MIMIDDIIHWHRWSDMEDDGVDVDDSDDDVDVDAGVGSLVE